MQQGRKPVLCYQIYEEPSAGGRYQRLVVYTFFAQEAMLDDKIEGTVGNRASYGDPATAERLGSFYQQMVDAGHDRILDSMLYGGAAPSIRLKWLIFGSDSMGGQPGYSDCDIELGDTKLMDTLKGAKFVKGIAMRIGRAENKAKDYGPFKGDDLSNHQLKDPAVVIEMLERMGAKKVKRFKGPNYLGEWVYDPSKRPWMLTDTLWRTFAQR